VRSDRARNGLVEGSLVLGALLLVPIALLAALRAPIGSGVGAVVLALVVATAVAWCVVTLELGRLVVAQVRRGAPPIETGPIAWAAVRVAALVLIVAPFLEPSSQHDSHRSADVSQRRTSSIVAQASTPSSAPIHLDVAPEQPTRALSPLARGAAARSAHAPRRARGGHRGPHGGVAPVNVGTGSILVALAAEMRRRSRMWRRVVVDDEAAIDVETALLGAPAAPSSLLAAVAGRLAAAGRLVDAVHVVVSGGTARLEDDSWCFDPEDRSSDVRCLVVVLGEDQDETHVALVPRGATLRLEGDGAPSLVADALRVAPTIGLGTPFRAEPAGLLHALATRHDDDLVVVVGECEAIAPALLEHCVRVQMPSPVPHATITASTATLPSGRVLVRSSLAAIVRDLLDGSHDHGFAPSVTALLGARGQLLGPIEEHGAVVRLLTAVPRVDGLVEPLVTSRERRAVELVAYLALRAGEPVTGERLRVRVLGTTASDAAAKTLFNVASSLRRALGDGPFGQRLPPAGRLGHYAVAPDVVCDVTVLEAWVDRARASKEPDEQMAWLRAALELIEGEPFATVLEGYDWFLTEGHLTRLQSVCEDAACELVDLALDQGLIALARLAVNQALLVDPFAERLAAASARVAAARQASFAAIDPAVRSTVPSAPVVS
jgi:hypothetical protein